jgi:hypothetical protein
MKKNVKGRRASVTLQANVQSSLVREEEYDGRSMIVAPVIMATECVMNGLLYPANELSKFPQSWNGRPVVINHPMKKGKPVSANSRKVLDEYKTGLLFNTKWSKKHGLMAEAWIEKDVCETKNETLLTNIEEENPVEVSTGMFVEVLEQEGTFGNKFYSGVATNIRPDHLALLPDDKGACSWEDGAGIPRINHRKGMMKVKSIKLNKCAVRLCNATGLQVNEMSHSDLRQALGAKIKEQVDELSNKSVWIVDVFDKYLVYEAYGEGVTELYKIGYTVSEDDQVTVVGAPVKVQKKTEYVKVEVNNQGDNAMKKADKIKAIIEANKGYTADDTSALESMDEKFIDTIHANVCGEAPAPEANKDMKDYLEGAPPAVREVLTESLAIHSQQKSKLIETLTGNSRCTFSKDELEAKGLPELKQLATLMGEDVETVMDFSLNSADDQNEDDDDAVPAMPSINWDEEGK